MFELDELRRNASSRRTFLAVMGAAGLGLAASQLLGGGLTPGASSTPGTVPAGVPNDQAQQFQGIPGTGNIQILNFALTLEILEADLYRQALNLASGKAITAALDANPNVYNLAVSGGGLDVGKTAAGFLYLKQFAYVEAAHREFLKTALGSAATTPNPNGYKFLSPPSNNLASILGKVLPLEETGVRAYLGALPYLTDLGLAQTAGTIFSTEARHSAAISVILNIDAGPRKMPDDLRVSSAQPSENTFEYVLKPSTVITAAGAYFA